MAGASRPALANILIGDATDPVCESVFRSRGHAVDFKPGLSKVRSVFVADAEHKSDDTKRYIRSS